MLNCEVPALGDEVAEADALLAEAESLSCNGGVVLLMLLELVIVAVRPVALLQVGPTVEFFPVTKLTAAHFDKSGGQQMKQQARIKKSSYLIQDTIRTMLDDLDQAFLPSKACWSMQMR